MIDLLRKTFLILFIFVLIVISSVNYFYNAQYTYVYAESHSEPVNRDEVVEAFRAYCKSRDLTIDGTVANAVTSFTTQTFNLLCNTLGIDITALQAEIYKAYSENSEGLPEFSHFIISSSGIAVLNRIFAQFLQDNDIEVGDTNVNKIVKSGRWFEDLDGNGCWVYEVHTAVNGTINNTYYSSDIDTYGSSYINTPDYFSSVRQSFNMTLNFNQNLSKSVQVRYQYFSRVHYVGLVLDYNGSRSAEMCASPNLTNWNYKGSPVIVYSKPSNRLLFAAGQTEPSSGYDLRLYVLMPIDNTSEDTDIILTTPEDEPIKPAYPDDEPLDIYPDGSTSNDPEHNVPEPGGSDPGWTIPDGSITPDGNGGSTFDWNFQLPNLNIDWSINGLTNKFPFCIPFDVVSFCQVLSAEPVAPRITGNVPIGTLTTWSFDYDLSEYNDWASILRTVELFGFVIGLIFITVKLVKG